MNQNSHSFRYYLLVTITQTTKLLLTSSVPTVKSNFSTVCEEVQWMHLHTNGSWFHKKNIRMNPIKRKIPNSTINRVNHQIQNILPKLVRSYFFSNSPVRCLFTNVVFPVNKYTRKSIIHSKYQV